MFPLSLVIIIENKHTCQRNTVETDKQEKNHNFFLIIDHLFSTRETEKITRTNTNFVYTEINSGKCLHFFYIRKYSRHIVHFLTLSSGYFSCRFNAKPQ